MRAASSSSLSTLAQSTQIKTVFFQCSDLFAEGHMCNFLKGHLLQSEYLERQSGQTPASVPTAEGRVCLEHPSLKGPSGSFTYGKGTKSDF